MFHPAKTLLCSALAATLLALAPGTAHADDSFYVQKSLHVQVSDLDASSPADAASLYGRIREAARQVCDNGTSIDRDCVQRAVNGAVRTVGQPLVTRLHTRRTGA
ncbi:MAG: hypothetical protein RL684_1472 [Pseudomonadota bacterium]|jgi:UrcA family protein